MYIRHNALVDICLNEMNDCYNGNIFFVLIGNKVTKQEKIRRVKLVEKESSEIFLLTQVELRSVNSFLFFKYEFNRIV